MDTMNATSSNCKPRPRGAGGFTLVELAIVLVIFGLTTSTAMAALRYYTGKQSTDNTIEALDRNYSIAFSFYGRYKRYPCPANPEAAPGDADYGIEDCTNASGNLITVNGRDVDNADGDNNIRTGGEPVVIGAFPFKTMLDPNQDGFTQDAISPTYIARYGTDGWNNKLTYAVTESMIDAQTFNSDNGAVFIEDEFQNNMLRQAGTAHYVILSHGANRIGAYGTNGGDPSLNCSNSVNGPPLPVPLPSTRYDETENCDNFDAVFLNGLRNDSDNNPYDDFLRYRVGSISNLWAFTGGVMFDNDTINDATDDYMILQVAAQNTGNVGIGTRQPEEKLQVSGNVKATQIRANNLCSPDGDPSLCMPVDAIAGDMPSMNCSNNGEVVVAITRNSVVCASPFSSIPAGTCPPSTLMRGISSRDGIICE